MNRILSIISVSSEHKSKFKKFCDKSIKATNNDIKKAKRYPIGKCSECLSEMSYLTDKQKKKCHRLC